MNQRGYKLLNPEQQYELEDWLIDYANTPYWESFEHIEDRTYSFVERVYPFRFHPDDGEPIMQEIRKIVVIAPPVIIKLGDYE